jgi:hypothetical protein
MEELTPQIALENLNAMAGRAPANRDEHIIAARSYEVLLRLLTSEEAEVVDEVETVEKKVRGSKTT